MRSTSGALNACALIRWWNWCTHAWLTIRRACRCVLARAARRALASISESPHATLPANPICWRLTGLTAWLALSQIAADDFVCLTLNTLIVNWDLARVARLTRQAALWDVSCAALLARLVAGISFEVSRLTLLTLLPFEFLACRTLSHTCGSIRRHVLRGGTCLTSAVYGRLTSLALINAVSSRGNILLALFWTL